MFGAKSRGRQRDVTCPDCDHRGKIWVPRRSISRLAPGYAGQRLVLERCKLCGGEGVVGR